MGADELEARVARLREEAAAAEREEHELAYKVRVAERLVARVGSVPRGWRLMVGISALAVGFWFGAIHGLDAWWFGLVAVLVGVSTVASAGKEEREVWERLERARLEAEPAAVRARAAPLGAERARLEAEPAAVRARAAPLGAEQEPHEEPRLEPARAAPSEAGQEPHEEPQQEDDAVQGRHGRA